MKSLTYATLIAAAYDWKLPTNYTVLKVLSDNFGWVLEDTVTSEIIIVVRGTTNINDWVANSNMDYVTTSLGKIHEGFVLETNKLYVDIIELLDTLPRNAQLILTGHSLGGAIVTILATILALHKANFTISVYTFASPRVGNRKFVNSYKAFNIKTCRFINKLDIVPMLPRGFGYEHVCPAKVFSDGVFGNISYNHDISTYINNVGKLTVDLILE